jgi:hypothetical protein
MNYYFLPRPYSSKVILVKTCFLTVQKENFSKSFLKKQVNVIFFFKLNQAFYSFLSQGTGTVERYNTKLDL